MRKDPFINDHYYHVYNRGVDKRDIFMSRKDVFRFILSAKCFNTTCPAGSFKENGRYKLCTKCLRSGNHKKKGKLVSIVCYCFNPNHFHFILKQEADGGISEFLKRLSGGYARYFNEVHKRSGALFQGRFKSHLIDKDKYFLKIFPYVNINYLIHDIPPEKLCLVSASDKEYEKNVFNLVSEKEARDLLEFYGGHRNFKTECMNVVSLVREQREKKEKNFSFADFSDVGHPVSDH